MAIIYVFDCIVWGLSIARVAESHDASPLRAPQRQWKWKDSKGFPISEAQQLPAGWKFVRSLFLSCCGSDVFSRTFQILKNCLWGGGPFNRLFCGRMADGTIRYKKLLYIYVDMI